MHSYIAVYIYSTVVCVHIKVSIVVIYVQMGLDLLHLFIFLYVFLLNHMSVGMVRRTSTGVFLWWFGWFF